MRLGQKPERLKGVVATYNQSSLKRFVIGLFLLLGAARAQDGAREGRLLLVLPFENKSSAPGLEWIGESFPEVLNQRLAEPSLFIIQREDRLFAFDRMGIPATANPSRATVYTVAQAMDVDYVIVGSYDYDGRIFSSSAQVLDMHKLHLSAPAVETGALTDLITVQTALAYDLLAEMDLPASGKSKQQFVASMPQVRLDALENYVRGALATNGDEKIQRFKEAVRISPDYAFAEMQLARTYFAGRDYESAANWFSKVPRTATQSLEATFFYGICEYYLGDFNKAQDAFQYVSSRLPLVEVQNNLGVLLARHNKPAATYFRTAVQADPQDADYRFNLAVALSQSGDNVEAAKQAREAVSLAPTDADARALLDSLSHSGAVAVAAPKRVFAPRLKREYNEAIFRQAELEMRNLEETTLAAKDPKSHAASHIERGNQMLANGFVDEAEQEFREAAQVDPALAGAHVGLARVALRRNNTTLAGAELERALAIDPADSEALSFRRELSARRP
ncbi:MAG: tetratricopeptide repeat protein [Acidobacteriales bacterium]|nr:tetratricopeptide repeat protein [Terriglobales bacterium]